MPLPFINALSRALERNAAQAHAAMAAMLQRSRGKEWLWKTLHRNRMPGKLLSRKTLRGLAQTSRAKREVSPTVPARPRRPSVTTPQRHSTTSNRPVKES
jgi:hypothetical protein